jgi:nucleoside-triphosphatase
MRHIYFLTGKPRIGKSTAIKKIIDHIGRDCCGGFYTEEIRDATNRVGFNCVSLDGEYRVIANVGSSSPFRIGRYGVDIQSFEDIALKVIKEATEQKQITVIDEVGFMQMLSPSFEQLIIETVSNARNIILGTICLDQHPSIDKIKKLPHVKLFLMNEQNREPLIEFLSNEIINVRKQGEQKSIE